MLVKEQWEFYCQGTRTKALASIFRAEWNQILFFLAKQLLCRCSQRKKTWKAGYDTKTLRGTQFQRQIAALRFNDICKNTCCDLLA